MPVYPNAADVTISCDDLMMAKKISYNINSIITPQDIYNHYNKELLKSDFIENIEDVFHNSEIENTSFIKDGDPSKPPARFHKGWLNSARNTIIKVSLSYYTDKKIYVGILMHPYASSDLLEEFLDKLKTSNKDNELFDLFSKYPGIGQALDTEKALREEPENKILTKYAELERKNKIEMEANYKEFNISLAQQNTPPENQGGEASVN
jgi:hypothetical protein